MDDLKIVELYLSRSEDAIAETDLKYGKLRSTGNSAVDRIQFF